VTLKFTETEIQLAHELKAAGLPWRPAPGHYVWDGNDLIEHGSPFHDRVFFILDLKHFLRRSETMERLIDELVWLPTWEQCRMLLAERGYDSQQVAQIIHESNAIGNDCERSELYRTLLHSL
jgi:hypothetical protein